MEEIVLFHTNDLHSHLENWPKIRRYLNHEKKRLEKLGKTVWIVDLGDFLDQVHPLTEATNGQANVALMNQVPYDAATIGNNEGVGLSKKVLDHLYKQANFPIVLDNLIDPATGQAPTWTVPYKVMTTPEGKNFGLLALTAPFTLTYTPNGWDVRPVAEALPKILAQFQETGDELILMSHLGINVDEWIAKNYPEIGLILGSHTHHLFRHGKEIGHVLLAAAGKYGRYIGKVSLTLANGKVIQRQAEVIETEKLPELEGDQKEIQGFFKTGQELLEQRTVAYLPVALKRQLDAPVSLFTEALKAVKETCQVEAAFLNTGLFLGDLEAGRVNSFQLHEILPHPMHLIKVTLSGQDLLRLLGEIKKNQGFITNFPMQGCGFRGKIMGQIVFAGIEADAAGNWLFNGAEIQAELAYTLATVDHLMFVPFFPTIELAGQIEFIFPDFLREVLGKYFSRHYPIP